MYAIATVIAVIAYSLLIYLAGIRYDALQYVSYLIYIGIVVFAIKAWRDKVNNGAPISFGGVMKYSTLLAVYYCVLISIWTFVFMKYIAPELTGELLAKQQEAMEAKNLPPEQVETAMKYTKMFMTPPVMAIVALVWNMILLTIINLVISAVMKKDPPVNFENQNPINTSAY
jgi:hypothetical protein